MTTIVPSTASRPHALRIDPHDAAHSGGRQTNTDKLGYREIAIWKEGVTL